MNIFLTILLIALVAYFVYAIRRTLRISSISVGLIEKYENDKENPQLVEEIFSAISSDELLKRILKRHQATKSDIARLHAKLLKWGDFRKYNRYIPITSFFNVTTLEYLLEHKNDHAKDLTQKMMNHFHF
ncbi:MAG: hypothetical protein K6G55_00730 [Selenomonadaceae bacterium]|nr:hypothetical protein [Selenomonadaceae bacterium]